MSTMQLAVISVRGVVQGVGFRPYIYSLANQYGLKGWVSNTSEGVNIQVEGSPHAIDLFCHDLPIKAPPAASIESISITYQQPRGYNIFEIRSSITSTEGYGLVSPDLATCARCKAEIFDQSDRRYRYAFTNCTDCGPRFTIIRDMPYDRHCTTMRSFKMCPQCQAEYDDSLQRRFHAQPNACPLCGPRLELCHTNGEKMQTQDVIWSAATLLREGKILAVKGLGGFLLACDATNEAAVALLRSRKRRPAKPLAVMVRGLEEARMHCRTSEQEASLLSSPAAPIVLLPWLESSNICRSVAPNLLYLGIMLPYTPLHHLLLQAAALPLVMTSGNLSEEPIAAQNDEALRRLGDIADYFLLHNRDIAARYDDSVAFVLDGNTQIVRRARGFAPFPLRLDLPGKAVLALGADEKNTFCLARKQHAFVSQHIGDMDSAETQEHLRNTLHDYKHIFRIEPQLIAHDLHPDYRSTALALELAASGGLPTLAVQHHHAHIASCMADNALKGRVIGVALDGTGYGTDGNIWGGEFLIAEYESFQRCGHLQYLPLPGGDAGIKRPYRIAAAYLRSLLGLSPAHIHGCLSRYAPLAEFELVVKQISHGLNAPLTSSMGRLFDAVSALLGIRGVIQYDAQAAIELEMKATACTDNIKQAYPFEISEKNPYIIGMKDLFGEIMTDLQKGISVQVISLKFHHSVAAMMLEMCRIIREDSGIADIALSGGVFQNRLLLGISMTALRGDGFRVYTHKDVPCNDGGISLGQAAVARASMS